VVAAVLAFSSTEGAWGARAASGDDVMAHLIRTRFGIDQLLLHGHLDGWMPTFAVGYQEFLFNGPGFTWMAGAVRLLTCGQLSNAGAVKVLTVASVAAMPPAVAYLARSFGLSARAAGVAAMLSLLVNSPYGVGLSSVFQTGLVPDQVGAVLSCVVLGGCMRLMSEHRPRQVVVVGVAAAGSRGFAASGSALRPIFTATASSAASRAPPSSASRTSTTAPRRPSTPRSRSA